MAEILIKNFAMPRCCAMCMPFYVGNEEGFYGQKTGRLYASKLKHKRQEDCPLVEVPTHGDLKDTNKILQWLNRICDEGQSVSVGEIIDYIDNAPTVIEAST